MQTMKADQLAAEVAARLRAERARLNLTLREVADMADVHYVSLSRYEQGKLPTLEALYKLAEAYGVDIAQLIPPSATVNDLPKGRRR